MRSQDRVLPVRFQTTLPEFQQPEFSVVRQHEEFIWLHDRYEECEDYAGIVVSHCLLDSHIAKRNLLNVVIS